MIIASHNSMIGLVFSINNNSYMKTTETIYTTMYDRDDGDADAIIMIMMMAYRCGW